MSYWLLKTEPDCYSWDNLVRDKKTAWDGVTNALALKHIRTMQKGDEALIYHTGDERSVIGIAQITSTPYPDPKEEDDRLVVVDLKPKEKLPHPVTISDIKADKTFDGWVFIRNGRLSVVPVPKEMWKRLLELAQGPLSREQMSALAEKAKRLGTTPERYVKELVNEDLAIEEEAKATNLAKLMAPVRANFKRSGMTERELDQLVDVARTQHHQRSSRKRGRK